MSTNWELCALCQKDTSEKLICPVKSAKKDGSSSYRTLENNIQRFQELGEVPIAVPLENLDDGIGNVLYFLTILIYT